MSLFSLNLFSLRETTSFFDNIILFFGTVFISNCKTCAKTSPGLYGVALQIVVFKVSLLIGPLLLFFILLCSLGTVLTIISKYHKWKNRARFNQMIGTIPVYNFSASTPGNVYGDIVIPPADANCVVCLQPYQDLVEIRVLSCKHHYHSDCIDQWICLTPTCPLCKRKVFESEPPSSAEDNA